MLTEFKMHVFRLEKMSFWVPKKRLATVFKKQESYGKPEQKVKLPNNDDTDEKFIVQPKIYVL